MKSVVIIVVSRRLNFTTTTLTVKTLAFLTRVILENGLKLKKSWISVSYFVPIVTARFMLKVQLSREIGIEKSGEFREACTASQ